MGLHFSPPAQLHSWRIKCNVFKVSNFCVMGLAQVALLKVFMALSACRPSAVPKYSLFIDIYDHYGLGTMHQFRMTPAWSVASLVFVSLLLALCESALSWPLANNNEGALKHLGSKLKSVRLLQSFVLCTLSNLVIIFTFALIALIIFYVFPVYRWTVCWQWMGVSLCRAYRALCGCPPFCAVPSPVCLSLTVPRF